jgi:hypothetical protein
LVNSTTSSLFPKKASFASLNSLSDNNELALLALTFFA